MKLKFMFKLTSLGFQACAKMRIHHSLTGSSMMRLSSISSILHNSTTQIVDIMCLISVDLFCRTLHFKSTGVYIRAVGRPQSRRDVIRCFGLHSLGQPELCALERYPAGR